MGNYQAIATVTAALRERVQDSLRSVTHLSDRPTVLTGKPDGEQPMFVGANVYLYHVEPNSRVRDAAGGPGVALDLFYLISFHGNDQRLEPQRLLAKAVMDLEANPVLSADSIRKMLEKKVNDYLADSDLPREAGSVRLSQLPLSLEDLSKLWSGLFQSKMMLSVSYKASVVLAAQDD